MNDNRENELISIPDGIPDENNNQEHEYIDIEAAFDFINKEIDRIYSNEV